MRLKLKSLSLFYHHGETSSTDIMFGLEDLREKNLTNGRNCYPICVDCNERGEDVTKQGKQYKMQTRKEKEARTKKVKMTKKKSKNAQGCEDTAICGMPQVDITQLVLSKE